MMRKKNKGENRINILIDNNYYRDNNCSNYNCYFNYHGVCLVTRKEHPEPLSYNKHCFRLILKDKSPENLKKLFQKKSYNIRRTMLANYPYLDDEKELNKRVWIKILSVNPNDQVEIEAKVGRLKIHSMLPFREIFEYELRRRYLDWVNEESLRSNFIDLKKAGLVKERSLT